MIHLVREAEGDAAGTLVLLHGRGADEHDLLGLADVLDPERRLHVVTPRAPLTIGGGYHWYVVPRVGFPDHDTFHAAYAKLRDFHDELWERTGLTPRQTVEQVHAAFIGRQPMGRLGKTEEIAQGYVSTDKSAAGRFV